MVDRSAIVQEWERVREMHHVPSTLYDHQLDAMSLIKERRHVFLGNIDTFYLAANKYGITAVPTGAGKTLPQLATILTLEGLSFENKIPTLVHKKFTGGVE